MKATLALWLALTPAALAHHSRHEFATETVELEGELTRVMWFNPHAAFMLEVTDQGGKQQAWRIELFGAPRTYEPAGISADLFRVGERLTVAGKVSKLRSNYFLGTNALLADGTEVVLGGGDDSDRRWSGASVIGLGYDGASLTVDEEKLSAAAEANLGIYRVWSLPTREVQRHLPFKPEALAARERWDVADNPLTRCEQPGMPLVMMQPAPFQFIADGDSIKLHAVYFDTVRTIHMANAPDDASAGSHLGRSVGRWEGRTLVVETTRIDYPYIDTRGTTQSEAIRTVERFTLSDDQSRLDYHLTIFDPATFTEPATYGKYLLALDQPFVAMDCRVF